MTKQTNTQPFLSRGKSPERESARKDAYSVLDGKGTEDTTQPDTRERPRFNTQNAGERGKYVDVRPKEAVRNSPSNASERLKPIFIFQWICWLWCFIVQVAVFGILSVLIYMGLYFESLLYFFLTFVPFCVLLFLSWKYLRLR